MVMVCGECRGNIDKHCESIAGAQVEVRATKEYSLQGVSDRVPRHARIRIRRIAKFVTIEFRKSHEKDMGKLCLGLNNV